jgi:DNA-binding beta-propeller fold protein YncE
MKAVKAAALGLFALAVTASAQPAALVQEGQIALPDTGGRIDHMAVDIARKRLFVAELGNGTLDVVDLSSGKVIHRIAGLKEPQGVAYEPKSDLLAVANGGDGSLRLYAAADFAPRGTVKLGEDADNVRVDVRNGHLVVGYGSGALAVIDPVKAQKLRDIALPGHPESFRLSGSRVFVNVPDAGQIVLADLDSGQVSGKWTPEQLASNFPLMLDDAGHVAVVLRTPARLTLLDAGSGKMVAGADTCGDSDDLFFDADRGRFYVSCGSGAVDVFSSDKTGLHKVARITTMWGARTSLFVPEMDRLFVAERAGLLGSKAAIAILRPAAR